MGHWGLLADKLGSKFEFSRVMRLLLSLFSSGDWIRRLFSYRAARHAGVIKNSLASPLLSRWRMWRYPLYYVFSFMRWKGKGKEICVLNYHIRQTKFESWKAEIANRIPLPIYFSSIFPRVICIYWVEGNSLVAYCYWEHTDLTGSSSWYCTTTTKYTKA